MKNIDVASFLVFILLISVFTACADSGDNITPTTADDTTAAQNEETVDFSKMNFIERLTYDKSFIPDNLPETDLEGYVYTIGFLDQGDGSAYYDDWIAAQPDGDVVNDAVYLRNSRISERFNIEFDYFSFPNTAEYPGTMTKVINAGEDVFDMVSLHPGYYASFVTSGYMTNLAVLDYLDFDQPWWMGDSVKAYSYHGNIYTTYGAGTAISVLATAPVMVYNKNIAADYNVGNLYDVVREGKWTYEYVKSIIKDMWIDLDNNEKKSDEDFFGMYYVHPNEAYTFLWTLGGKYIAKDTDDEPYLDINNEKNIRIFDAVRDMAQNWDGIYYAKSYETDTDVFVGGRALFQRAVLIIINKLRSVDFEYGILPNFKLDEEQVNYITSGGGGPEGIPITCADKNRSALIMEALNAESYKTVIPAYYETAVKVKYTYDEDSAEMLDMIFNNVVYDPSYIFCHGATYSIADHCLGKTEFSSWYASKEKGFNKEIETAAASFAVVAEAGN
ncbi:MAG: hypothetical protein PHZ09_04575 [Eubacteriales bacterium]|jgi:hypothetical protein|nr:hypothetical protein [Eubacteriales bacterium]